MDAPAHDIEHRQESAPLDLLEEALRPGVLSRDATVLEALAADLGLATLMRSLSQISPAVAHDLRAPINAMVFNLEVLKETLAAGPSLDPAMRERQLRYVNVLKEELQRLHRSLEIFLAHIAPRGDRTESLDLRELVEELASLLVAPARKQQVQVRSELPQEPVPLEANRFLLRQALLHTALAALAPVPRQGTLEIRLERRDGQAGLWLGGSPAQGEGEKAAPEQGFDLRFTPGGTLAQLHVARAILASQGGDLQAVDGEAMPAYEVKWKASDKEQV
jgi:signal transduction histidine kinase